MKVRDWCLTHGAPWEVENDGFCLQRMRRLGMEGADCVRGRVVELTEDCPECHEGHIPSPTEDDPYGVLGCPFCGPGGFTRGTGTSPVGWVVVDDCDRCENGKVGSPHVMVSDCPSCQGRGWTPRGTVVLVLPWKEDA